MAGEKIEIFSTLRAAFSDFSQLHIGEGLGVLSELGGELGAAIIGGMTGYFLFRVLRNENLKPRQKILPAIGYALGIFMAVTILVVLMAGSATLIPPFMFAATVVGTIRNLANYLEERKERNNLRKENISFSDLFKKIQKHNLSDENKQKLLSYIVAPQEIYLELYQLRDSVIQSGKISTEKKNELVNTINQAIEDFYKGKPDINIKLDLDGLPLELKTDLEAKSNALSQRLNRYRDLGVDVYHMNLSSALSKDIARHQLNQEKIYSQDLPESIKNTMQGFLENKKVSKRELNDLYLRMGNHYINTSTEYQLNTQDEQYKQRIMKWVHNEQDLNLCVDYYSKPRNIYSTFQFLKIKVDHSYPELSTSLNDMMERFKNNPLLVENIIQDVENILSQTEGVNSELTHLLNELNQFRSIVSQYRANSPLEREKARLEGLAPTEKTNKKLAKVNDLIKSVEQHQTNGLLQFSNQFGQQFASPNIEINYSKYNLIEQLSKSFSDEKAERKGFLRRIKSIAKRTKSEPLKQLYADPEKTDDFHSRYAATFNTMEKIERLRYLENSVPKRLASVGFSAMVALASLAMTFIIPALASPVAPVAGAAMVAVGAISSAFSFACVAIGVDIMVRDIKTKMKLSKAQGDITEAVVPTLDKVDRQRTKKQGDKRKSVTIAYQKSCDYHGEAKPSAQKDSPHRNRHHP